MWRCSAGAFSLLPERLKGWSDMEYIPDWCDWEDFVPNESSERCCECGEKAEYEDFLPANKIAPFVFGEGDWLCPRCAAEYEKPFTQRLKEILEAANA